MAVLKEPIERTPYPMNFIKWRMGRIEGRDYRCHQSLIIE